MSAVSIHTPTKGVTFYCTLNNAQRFCFNPHTHEGCDVNSTRPLISKDSFNPHTHEGCDLRLLACGWLVVVSIHTPTKGVTSPPFRFDEVIFSFNPHTHEGCDPFSPANRGYMCCFNPHTHEGCDQACKGFADKILRFNPHTHEGCDADV